MPSGRGADLVPTATRADELGAIQRTGRGPDNTLSLTGQSVRFMNIPWMLAERSFRVIVARVADYRATEVPPRLHGSQELPCFDDVL